MKRMRWPRFRQGRPSSAGTTLIELMASMAILSVLLVVLGSTLEVALGRFRSGTDKQVSHGGANLAVAWIEADLASHLSSRSSNLPRLPEAVSPVQREFFENKLLLPFEINRTQGTGMPEGRSFQNAAPEFASLAFVTHRALTGIEAGEEGPSIVGYYVSYARNSPLGGDERRGMKLFRHFRRGLPGLGDGGSTGIILHVSQAINDQWDETAPGASRPLEAPNESAVRQGQFRNQDLPFLLSSRVSSREDMTPVFATQPWPSYPVVERLGSPPPTFSPDRGSEAAWRDPSHPVHDSVFPDEPMCDHVVRFELTPYRRVVLSDGTTEVMDAAALNGHLGLPESGEWPVLVTPDFIEVLITTVNEKAALTLRRYDDWIIDWEQTDPVLWSEGRKIIEREMATHRYRVQLPPRST